VAYATTADFEDYLTPLDVAVPSNAAGLLRLASDMVDELLIGAVYDHDDDGDPTDPTDQAALRKATCAQAHYLMTTGDLTGAQASLQSASVGSVSWTRASSAAGGVVQARYAPAAVAALRVAGLTPNATRRWGV
jgi:hypothetical protein